MTVNAIASGEEILISPDKHNPQEVEQRTKEALAEIKAGQRFLEVAKRYSDDPNSSEGGERSSEYL